jgi:hypothetical protein
MTENEEVTNDNGSETPSPSAEGNTEREPVASQRTEPAKTFRSALRQHLKESPIAPGEANTAVKGATQKSAPSAEVARGSPPAAESPVAVLAPSDMTPREKEHFAKLPPEMQQYLSRRQYEWRADYRKQTDALRKQSTAIGGVLEELAPYREEFARQNISERDIVRRSLAWDRRLKADPVAGAREYLAAYGIDPAELIEGAAQNSTSQASHAALDESTVEAIAEKKLKEHLQRQESERYTHTAASAIQSFTSSKPLFRDPETARQLVAAMAPITEALTRQNPGSDPTQILETAYNYVTRGDPRFSEIISRFEAASKAQETRRDANSAISASRTISGGPGVGTPAIKHKSFGDALRANLRG